MHQSLKIPSNPNRSTQRLSSRKAKVRKRVMWTCTAEDWDGLKAIQNLYYEKIIGRPVAMSLVMRRSVDHLADFIRKNIHSPEAAKAEAAELLKLRG